MQRITRPTRKVLEIFLSAPLAERYGLELMGLTGLSSGSLYPLLHRLEAAGWVTSRTEPIDPVVEKRPARRLYSLTGVGERVARDVTVSRGSLMRGLGHATPIWSGPIGSRG